MAQYVDKAILVAEIKNLLKPIKQRLERDKNDPWDSDIALYKFGNQLIKNINTFEVKEVDLEKEIENYLSTYWPKEKELHPFLGHIAKYFFELGMAVSNKT